MRHRTYNLWDSMLMLCIALWTPEVVSDLHPLDPSITEGSEATDEWTGRSIPINEGHFIEIIKKAQQASLQGGDQNTIRHQRLKALESYREPRIEHWIGLLSHMPDDGGDGNISIRVTIAKDITLETNFDIAPTSEIFKAANPLPYGTIVEVSGHFIMDAKGKDYFEETRITTSGGLESPSFKYEITAFKALD